MCEKVVKVRKKKQWVLLAELKSSKAHEVEDVFKSPVSCVCGIRCRPGGICHPGWSVCKKLGHLSLERAEGNWSFLGEYISLQFLPVCRRESTLQHRIKAASGVVWATGAARPHRPLLTCSHWTSGNRPLTFPLCTLPAFLLVLFP